MRKTLVLTLTFLLFFTSVSICNGAFSVYPVEQSITMGDEFISGNTSRAITVGNYEDQSINISWYFDHPVPISDIRPDKTPIPDLSWIDIEPQLQIISPQSSATFYIHLNIPESKEYLNQHWETWITFKQEKKQFINIEAAIRLYINTPMELITNNDQNSDALSISSGDQNKLTFFDIAIAAVIILILLTISILFVKKKKL